MLDCDPADLWPDLFPIMTPPSAGTVAVSVYSSRADVPITVWKQLFEDAAEHLDILVYGGTFLFDGLPRFTKMLAAATERGVAVRFIIGDPECATVMQRGAERRHRSRPRCTLPYDIDTPATTFGHFGTGDPHPHHTAVHIDVPRR